MAITMDGIFVNGQQAVFHPENILSGDASAYTQEIGTAVEAWMEENVTGGEQVTDTTLTLSGVPADAKETGDRISAVKEDLSANSTYINEGIAHWTQGGLNVNTGENLTATNICRSPNYLNFKEASNLVTITAKNGYKFNLFEYTETLTYVKCYDWTDTALTEALDTSHYYRMAVAITDDSTIAPADVPSDVVDIIYITNTNSALEESPNLFYLSIPQNIKKGITVTENADGTVTVDGTATDKVAFFILGASGSGLDCVPNIDAGVTYIFSRELVSGTENNGNPFFQYKDDNQNTLKTVLVRTPYVFGTNARVLLCFLGGYSFTNATYRFNIVKSDYPVPYIQRNTFTAKDDVARYWVKKYKPYSGYNIYFTVSVDRPLPFGTDDAPTDTVDIECALKLPSSYSDNGKPTRLILCCHGSGSYISASADKWGTTDFQTFVNALASNGYGVFDCNIFPSTADISVVGYHLGSPLYVQICKKAYDYIVDKYNVYPEIFVHGISMGGVGATAFAHIYPQIVIAESSFAGRDFLLYIHNAVTSWTAEEKLQFANAYGYDTYADAETDKWSHCVGYYPSLSLMGISNGGLELPPDRESDFNNWLAWFSAFLDYAKTDTFGIYMARRNTPYKAWNSWSDRVGDTKLEEILQKAYNTGNSCPYYIVEYESYSHNQMCYGKVEDMIPQLMSYYAQFE